MSKFSLSAAKNKLLGEGAWVALGQFLVAVGTLLGVRLITEMVSPQVFGKVALLLGLIALGQNLFSAPLLNAAYRFYADVGSEGTSRLRSLLVRPLQLSTMGLVASLLVGGAFYVLFVGGVSWLVFVALAGLLSAEIYRGVEWSFLGAARRQRAAAMWQAAEAWLRPGLAIALVFLFGSSASAVLVGYLLGCGGLYLGVKLLRPGLLEGDQTTPQPNHEEVGSSSEDKHASSPSLQRQIFHYALPLMPLALVGWISSLSDRYLIGGLLGATQVGLYAAVYGSVLKPFQILGAVVSQTLLPVFNQAVSAGERQQERKLFWLWLGLIATFSFLGAAMISVLNHWLAWILLAKSYRSSAHLFGFLALGFSLLNIAHVFEYQLYSYKRTDSILLGQTVAAAGSLAVTVPMILWKGLLGAALACPLYYFLYLIMMASLHRLAVRRHHAGTDEVPENLESA